MSTPVRPLDRPLHRQGSGHLTGGEPAPTDDDPRGATGRLRRAGRRRSRRDVEFETFYREEVDGVYRALAIALADAHLAQEATHEGMARAYQRWHRIADYQRPAGWVYRVGLNWARSRLRKTGREVLTHRPEVEPSPDHDLDPDLRRALATLTIDARSVVVLRYLLGWSTSDTAAALGIADGTVKSRLARALSQLETLLEERS